MTRRPPRRTSPRDRLGLTNGNGPARPVAPRDGFTNGRGRTNGIGRTNGLTNGRGATNGFTNGRGRTNGLVNGLGRTNGLTNGRGNGFTNGRGRTNGSGLVNGFINGSIRSPLRRNRVGIITHRDLRYGVSVVVLFLLLLAPFYILLSTTPVSATRITVDGDLSDWTAAPAVRFLRDVVASPDGDISLTKYSALEDGGTLSFAISVGGSALGATSGLDSVHVFIDSDGNPATGYRAREIGADYMVGVDGSNGTVRTAALYAFATGADPRNWTAWDRVGSVAAAARADSLEIQIGPNGVVLGPAASFLVHLANPAGSEVTSSVHFGLALRALLVTQEPAAPVVPSPGAPFALLRFDSFGDAVDVTSVSLTKLHGPGTLTSLGSFTVDGKAFRNVSVAYAAPGDYVSARLDPSGIAVLDAVPVTIAGADVVAYLGSAPTDHRVDGYFGDWPSVAVDTTRVPNPNVDIEHHAANRTGSTAFVYADVAGSVFAGSMSPVQALPTRPSGGGGQAGPPAPARPRIGEDVFLAYLQLDILRPVGRPALGIYADFYIDVRGQYGKVVSAKAYAWGPSGWTASSRAVEVANDRSRMEASLDLTGLAPQVMALAIQSSDWGRYTDVTGVYNFVREPSSGGTRGDAGPRILYGTNANVTALSMSSAPTVDGKCDDSVYSQAGYVSNASFHFRAGFNGNYLYVCIVVSADTTNSTGDFATILFDGLNNGGTSPQLDDRNYTVTQSNTTTFSRGTGSGWTACGSWCDSADAAKHWFGTNVSYEFKVNKAEAWNGTTNPAGFAVYLYDGGPPASYKWGSSAMDPFAPNTWGNIYIPEFPDILLPLAIVGVIYLVGRRRRRAPDP